MRYIREEKGLPRILCKVQTRVKLKLAGRVLSLLFQYNRNKAKNQALVRQPVSEKYLQLGMDNAPFPALARPFFRDVHHRQIQHFQQAVVGRKHRFGFCDLAQLPVKSFNGIGGVNQRPYLLRIFEICGSFRPVGLPRLGDFWVFGVPFPAEGFQLVQCCFFIDGGVYALQVCH